MNWKNDLKLSDLDPKTKIEIECKRCKLVRVETQAELIARTGLGQNLYLDEVEFSLQCTNRFCRGGVRISLLWEDKYEGWVGGMA